MAHPAPNITASGYSFAQFQSGGASGQLEALIAANKAGTAAPTSAVTATATGGGATGGLLAAGTYYPIHTETNGNGETTVGPEGAQLTVGSTNIPRFTRPTFKTGNSAWNLYLGKVGGSTGGPYFLYATGITATTYDAAVAVPVNSWATMKPPTVNTTPFSFTDANGNVINKVYEYVRACKDGNLDMVYRELAKEMSDFNRGNPGTFGSFKAKLQRIGTAFTIMATACNEMGTLIDSNPGTLGNVLTGIGGSSTKRTWP